MKKALSFIIQCLLIVLREAGVFQTLLNSKQLFI